ncbi:XRE family transcriptional regulator [Limosilactobacillus oris]|uniref:XRE family transcriptional regulator n=1 Tax=Limosilactobacillus oris TaxID=1632 RepID=UPI0024B351EE|nr:XRE family transcriptional regulator [Limosilactobacillus oris]WHO86422.1 XRE family transcriptional regulator [Limosilactobacillus oris]
MPKKINLKLIKETRIKLGFTYNDMAKALMLKEPEKYYRRENGTYNFQATEIPLLAHKLKIPMAKIFK